MRTQLLLLLIFVMPLVIADQGDIEVYKPNEVFDLSVHLTNNTEEVIGATCAIQIRSENYTVILNDGMNEIGGGWYNYSYNTSETGKYFCRQNCTLAYNYAAATCDFVIKGDENMPIAIIIGVILVIGLYFLVLINMFTTKQFTEHGLVKLLFLMTAFWMFLLPINMAMEYNEFNGGPDAITSGLVMLYRVMIILNSLVLTYFVLWFIIQLAKKLNEARSSV